MGRARAGAVLWLQMLMEIRSFHMPQQAAVPVSAERQPWCTTQPVRTLLCHHSRL